MDDLKNIVESLLFVADEPLTIERLKQIVSGSETKALREALDELMIDYETRQGGFYLNPVAGGYQIRTRPEYMEYIKRLLQPKPQRLSKAALETLAIIAYKQPVIRADIEHLRGVDLGGRRIIKKCLDLDGNPASDLDWPVAKIQYMDAGREKEMELSTTFVDFAVTEARFRKHFRKAPPETWNENMIPLHEFLQQDVEDREGLYPYIWGIDGKNRLMRVMVSEHLVRASEDRLHYWRQLKSLTGIDNIVDEDAIVNQARAEMAQKLSASLLGLVSSGDTTGLLDGAGAIAADGTMAAATGVAASADYEPVWIDTPECQSCDECTQINEKIFAYNDEKKAIIVDPRGGPYKDIVRAAEKCTAECIHPGTPFNSKESGLERLIKRAEKFQ